MLAHGESSVPTEKDATKSPTPKINLRHGNRLSMFMAWNISTYIAIQISTLFRSKNLPMNCSELYSPAAQSIAIASPIPRRRTSSRLRKERKTSPKDSTRIGIPLVVLALDEAHVLTDIQAAGDGETWSAFSEFRRALRALNDYRLFSLFLSTTGKINQFTSAAGEDLSNRVQEGHLTLIDPFTDLGFDQIARKIAGDGSWTLDDVAADAYMVCLGRPMYFNFIIFNHVILRSRRQIG